MTARSLDNGNLNLIWCRSLLEGLRCVGVERVVLSPGSRSTPLALAAGRDPGLGIHVILDERSAAFFALGAARGSGRPVALVATSGSAVANWLPAVVESDLSRVPLVLLSADRPPELRGWGANQTIDQPGLFGSRVRLCRELPVPFQSRDSFAQVHRSGAQAAAAARWPLPGPVHLNVPLHEPLVPDGGSHTQLESDADSPLQVYRPTPRGVPAGTVQLGDELAGGRGVIVCGPAPGEPLPVEAVAELAAAADCPVLADPLSGLRCGPHDKSRIMTRYEAYLRDPEIRDHIGPDWVIRLGGMPVAKAVGHYLRACAGVPQVVIDPHGRWTDPLHTSTHFLHADPAAVCRTLASAATEAQPGWCGAWCAFEKRAAAFPARALPAEARVVDVLAAALPADSVLFSGNSMPIRELDAFLSRRDEPLHLIANRGASGIDGNLSTLLGLAAVASGPVVALLGDLACVHDLGALAAAPGLNAVILVIDNGGGGIFGYLPQAGLDEFESLFLTPQTVDLGAAAAAYGVRYRRLDGVDGLGEELVGALGRGGVDLLIIPIDRRVSAMAHRGYWNRAASAS